MIELGTKVQNFVLKNEEGKDIALDSFLGKKVVLYFYPKDATPGCTTQACVFKSVFDEYEKMNTVVIGISPDSVDSHKKFKEREGLPFVLLSDENREVIEPFGVWQEKSMYGKKYFGVVRSTFVLNEDHQVIKMYEKATPATNAIEILDYLKTL